MKFIEKAIIFGVPVFLLFLVVFWSGGDYCEYNNHTNQENCTHYSTPLYGVPVIARMLNDNEGTVVGLGTLFVALFTFALWYSTSKLWEEAIEASKVAKVSADAAKASIDAHRATERAWLTVTDTPLYELIFDEDEITGEAFPGGIGFYIRWKNTGRTPAINCVLFSESITQFINTDDIEWKRRISIITSGEDFIGPGCYFSQSDFDRIKNSKEILMIYGKVVYEDVFTNVPKSTEACFIVSYGGLKNGSYNFIFTPHGPMNKAT